MNVTKGISAAAAAVLVIAGAAAAQTFTPGDFVAVTTGAATTTPAAGATGAVIGTLQITARQGGAYGNASLAAIPVTITAANGAALGNLAGCGLYGETGQSLTAGSAVATPSGTNTFTFDSPLTLSGGTAANLTLRCNTSSSLPAGGSFAITAGTPQWAPYLGVNLNASPSVARGGSDAVLGVITLDASRSGAAIDVVSLPITATYGAGMSGSQLTDCRVRPASDLTRSLTTGFNAPANLGESGTFRFDIPQQVPAGSKFTYALTCDVNAAAPLNGSVALTLNPSGVQAGHAVTGSAVTAVAGFAPNSTSVGSTSGTVLVSPTGTTPTTPTTTPTIPGIPNTGGFSPETLIMLILSGMLVVGGAAYLARRRAA